jgi:hypothetical protein
MLVACRLAGLSALETYYAGARVGAQCRAVCGCAGCGWPRPVGCLKGPRGPGSPLPGAAIAYWPFLSRTPGCSPFVNSTPARSRSLSGIRSTHYAKSMKNAQIGRIAAGACTVFYFARG